MKFVSFDMNGNMNARRLLDEIDNWDLYTLNDCPDCGSQVELFPESPNQLRYNPIDENRGKFSCLIPR